ncbi:antitoxin VbhA family protein [Devriesea agamarum]|uniref:antitoxin VbhA family protein n=1 Tax=Devriesea agamarum TaxID=472569 RepID=UPI000B279C43|nr:hypothetical protein [Devriesea agamarum]
MATEQRLSTTASERARHVAEAIHSIEMEGLSVSAAARQDDAEYIAGRIDSDELVARARTLWTHLILLTRISIPRRVC